MSRELSLKMKTLTPLWTGGVKIGSMDRLHETAIIGSLRWWYEAVVRGLDGRACNYDDNKKSKCQFNADEYNKNKKLPPRERLHKAGLCDVCQLFGATGWKRRFSVSIGEGGSLLFNNMQHDKILLPSGHVHYGRNKNRAGGWYLMRDSLAGEIPLDFWFKDSKDAERMKIVLKLIERHGAMGGKKSSGYGVVRLKEAGTEKSLEADPSAFPRTKNLPTPRRCQHPDLRDFYFATIQFTSQNEEWWLSLQENRLALETDITDARNELTANNPNPHKDIVNNIFKECFNKCEMRPLAPSIRNQLRFQWGETATTPGQRNYLFGSTDSLECTHYLMGDEIRGLASKVNVSHAYLIDKNSSRWEFRIWGWLPYPNRPVLMNHERDSLLYDLRSALVSLDFGNGITFSHDNCRSFIFLMEDQNDGMNYLQNLLTTSEDTPE